MRRESRKRGPGNWRRRSTAPVESDDVYQFHRGGYNFFDDQPSGVSAVGRMRVWSHNLDVLGSSRPERVEAELNLVQQAHMDIICWQDLKLEQPAWDRVVTKSADIFKDKHLVTKFVRPTRASQVNHGLALIVRDGWSRRILSWVEDPSGLGRWLGVIFQGALGEVDDLSDEMGGSSEREYRQLILITMYLPCVGSHDGRQQAGILGAGTDVEAAYMQALEDLDVVIRGLMNSKTSVIFMGDINVSWDLRNRVSTTPLDTAHARRMEAIHGWAFEMDVVNVLSEFMVLPFYTFRSTVDTSAGVDFRDDKDVIFVSSMAARSAVTAVGVLHNVEGSRQVMQSGHAPVCLELDTINILGCDRRDLRHERFILDRSVLRTQSPPWMLEKFISTVERRWAVRDYHTRVSKAMRRVTLRPLDYATWNSLDSLMSEMVKSVVHADRSLDQRPSIEPGLLTEHGANSRTLEATVTLRQIQAMLRVCERGDMENAERRRRKLAKSHPVLASHLGCRDASFRCPGVCDGFKSRASGVIHDVQRGVMAEYLLERMRRLGAPKGPEESPVGSLKQLMVEVSGKSVRAKPYASVTVQDGRRRRVISDPKSVARELIKALKLVFVVNKYDGVWFRNHPISEDSLSGRKLRQYVAEYGDDVDMVALGIPVHFKPVLKHMKKLAVLQAAWYDGVVAEISEQEWIALWKSKKKGTAPGRSRMTVDMIANLPPEVLEDFRTMVNTVLHPNGRVFSSWRERVITLIPKVEGDVSVENARPINLLDVIMKGFWAIIIARIQNVWQKHGLLHPMQFAFCKNSRIEAPALLAMMLSEKHVEKKTALYACTQDVKKAYDTVDLFVGKEMALRRLGVPELIIERMLDMDRENHTAVVTAYGMSDVLLGDEGAFTMGRGICQGGAEGPHVWVAFYDILLRLQDDFACDDDPVVVDDDGSVATVKGSCFADDTFWLSGSRRSMELRINVTALFLEFMGMQTNVKKSLLMGLEFGVGNVGSPVRRTDLSSTGWKPRVYAVDQLFAYGQLQSVSDCVTRLSVVRYVAEFQVASLQEGVKWLGFQFSIAPRAELTTDYLDGMITRARSQFEFWGPVMLLWAADSFYDQIWMKAKYLLTFGQVTEHQVIALERSVRAKYKKAMKLFPRNSLIRLSRYYGGLDKSLWYDKMMDSRMKLVLSWMKSKTVYGICIRENLRNLQLWASTATPILEDPRSVELASRRTWLSSVCVWMAKRQLRISGSPPLPGGVPNDVAIVDLGTSKEERDVLRRGCRHYNTYWVSQMMAGGICRSIGISSGPWAELIADRMSDDWNRLPSDSDRLTTGCVITGDIVLRGQLTDRGCFGNISKVALCVGNSVHLIPLTVTAALGPLRADGYGMYNGIGTFLEYCDPLAFNMNDLMVLENTEWNMRDNIFPVETCLKHQVMRIPKDLRSIGGHLLIRMTSDYLVKLGHSMRSALLSCELETGSSYVGVASLAPWVPPVTRQESKFNEVVSWLARNGITYETLLPGRGKDVVQGIKNGDFMHVCKLGSDYPPEGGWNGKTIGVSDGSLRDDRGTAAFVAESYNREWSGSLKIPQDLDETMSSYRMEGGGLLLMLLTLYLCPEVETLEAWCDNWELVQRVKTGDFLNPRTYGSSLDVVDMLLWCKMIWGSKLLLDWCRGHPEKRDPTGETWTKQEWLNFAADAVAGAEYQEGDGLYLKSLLISRRDVAVFHRGRRLVDLHSTTICSIMNRQPLDELCKLYNVPIESIDWIATSITVGRCKSIYQRRIMMHFQWETQYTNVRKVEMNHTDDRCYRWPGRDYDTQLQPILEARCRCCVHEQAETISHLLASCDAFTELRTQWYTEELDVIASEEPEFEPVFRASVQLVNGRLTSGHPDIAIGDILKARIPKSWTAVRDWHYRVLSNEYLRGYGQRLRQYWNAIWAARMQDYQIWLVDPVEDAFARAGILETLLEL